MTDKTMPKIEAAIIKVVGIFDYNKKNLRDFLHHCELKEIFPLDETK